MQVVTYPTPKTMALRPLTLAIALLVSSTLASHPLLSRYDLVNSVCSPNFTTTSSDTIIPPCIEIETIQGALHAQPYHRALLRRQRRMHVHVVLL